MNISVNINTFFSPVNINVTRVPCYQASQREWRWLIILKLPQLNQFSNIYFSPLPGIFLILGKLINKLKHHLSPGLLVLYDQVMKNGNKIRVVEFSDKRTELDCPNCGKGRGADQPSKPV